MRCEYTIESVKATKEAMEVRQQVELGTIPEFTCPECTETKLSDELKSPCVNMYCNDCYPADPKGLSDKDAEDHYHYYFCPEDFYEDYPDGDHTE